MKSPRENADDSVQTEPNSNSQTFHNFYNWNTGTKSSITGTQFFESEILLYMNIHKTENINACEHLYWRIEWIITKVEAQPNKWMLDISWCPYVQSAATRFDSIKCTRQKNSTYLNSLKLPIELHRNVSFPFSNTKKKDGKENTKKKNFEITKKQNTKLTHTDARANGHQPKQIQVYEPLFA